MAGPSSGLVDGQVCEAAAFASRPEQGPEGLQPDVQVLPGDLFQSMRQVLGGIDEVARQRRVTDHSAEFDPVASQDDGGPLALVDQLQAPGIG
jgi:hypothetical protein